MGRFTVSQTFRRVAIVAAALVLCGLFGYLLVSYTVPMRDNSYSFSLFGESETTPDDWVYDQKGWTVFCQEGENVTGLQPDGIGGFYGALPGQTFYFSRLMTEEVDSPVLYIGAANRTVAVFLDGELLYTDCPELDNRIGALTLPELEWDRYEPVTVTLPWHYVGKTLTVAQSTSPFGNDSQHESFKVWPAVVTLACSYSAESRLISESFQTAVPVTLGYIVGVFLLVVFGFQVFRGTPDFGSLFGALLAFFWMTRRLFSTSFFDQYFSFTSIVVTVSECLVPDVILLLLFVLLALRMSGKRRRILWIVSVFQCVPLCVSGINAVIQIFELLFARSLNVDQIMGLFRLAELLCAFVCCLCEWKQGSRFFRVFNCLVSAGILAWAAAVAISALSGGTLARNVWEQLSLYAFSYFEYRLSRLMVVGALIVYFMQAVRQEMERRTELQMLVQRQSLEAQNYENIRRQHEEFMLLRHDMAKHFALLRQMTHEEQTAGYLDELIGQNKKIRPVVQSGNNIFDIVLNTNISRASDEGITVEIVRMQVPGQLPLTDAELSSLAMNLMDNALAGACSSGAENPFIRLDLHIQDNFFLFDVENSAAAEQVIKKPAAGHGYGLKIIRQTVEHCGGLLEAGYHLGSYNAAVAIPLALPCK